MTQEQAFDDAAFIRDDDSWPNWPLLPIKRPKKDEGWPETALITAGEKTVVIHAGMFDGQGIHDAKRTSYDSIEALVADGWRVD